MERRLGKPQNSIEQEYCARVESREQDGQVEQLAAIRRAFGTTPRVKAIRNCFNS